MTSAFSAPLQTTSPDRPAPGFHLFSASEEDREIAPRELESETEDEEVKINCMGGFRGGTDSDMYSSEEDSDEEDCTGGNHDEPSVPNFVSDCVTTPKRLIRPRATSFGSRLSTLEESSEEQEMSEVSVGARGVPLSVDGGDEDSDAELSAIYSVHEEVSSNEEEPSIMQEDGSNDEAEEASFADGEDEDESETDDDTDSEDEHEDDDISQKACSPDSVKVITSSSEGESPAQEEEVLSADEGATVMIGVSRDRSTPQNTPRVKRNLSSHNIMGYDYPRLGCAVEGSPKRLRSDSDIPLVSLTLEDAALTEPVGKVHVASFRCPSTSDEEQEEIMDGQLREELDGYHSDCREPNSPVPLLTPPASPQPAVCEWPSNLVVDSAMTAVITEIQPLSPVSMENNEVEDQQVSKDFSDGTSLTPLLRSLVVEKDFLC